MLAWHNVVNGSGIGDLVVPRGTDAPLLQAVGGGDCCVVHPVRQCGCAHTRYTPSGDANAGIPSTCRGGVFAWAVFMCVPLPV